MFPRLTPLSLALLYLVFAAFWIVASGYFLAVSVDDPVMQGRLELGKGLAFVLVTASLLYLVLKAWYESLMALRIHLQTTLDALPDLLFEVDLDGRFYEYHSPRADLLAMPPEAFLGKTIRQVMTSDVAEISYAALREANVRGFSHGWQFELPLPEGKRWFELSVAKKQLGPGERPRFIVLSRDITDRKLSELNLQRQTQLYSVLSECNQAFVRCADTDELFQRVCRNAVVLGGIRMAWIGMLDPTGRVLRPAATYGEGADSLAGLEISAAADGPYGRGPCGAAFREGRPVWLDDFRNDPDTVLWHESAIRYGWEAAASLPLRLDGSVVGTFNLYASERYAFDQAARNLLVDLAEDISYALTNLERESRRKAAEEGLCKLSMAVEQSPNTIIICDPKGDVEYANDAFTKASGYGRDEIIGQHPRLLQSDKTPQAVYDDMWAFLARGESWQGELVNRRKDGSEYIVYVRVSPVHGADGEVSHYLFIEDDITEQRRADERIRYLTNFDVLTGLPSRVQLEDLAKYAFQLAKRNERQLALFFLDLDHFKVINDSLGHNTGDALLIEAAARLKAALREEDMVSRLGGDEFAILSPSTDEEGAACVAQKLLDVLAKPYQIKQQDLTVTASIGIALYPDDGQDFETLSKNADAAMYRAKQEGRNSYCFYTGEMQGRLVRRLELVSALRFALEREQLEVHYQPQVSLRHGHVVGAEALLRWRHPKLGMVPPAEFIPVAEDNGLILPIGEWVLQTAARQMKTWLDAGFGPMSIAVNLSAVQFRHMDLCGLIERTLDATGLPPEYLDLELTESVAMHDPEGVIVLMNKLNERGLRMSIDDFGTGYSSMSYLKKFKAYKLKIDRSFVRDVCADAEDKAIVCAIINMAKSLGIKTIAEGVELEDQLDFLREQGCDEVQGYYYSRPLPAAEFEQFVRSRQAGHPG